MWLTNQEIPPIGLGVGQTIFVSKANKIAAPQHSGVCYSEVQRKKQCGYSEITT